MHRPGPPRPKPNTPLAPIGLTVEERYQHWLADQSAAGATFTPEQRRWLDAIKDHIATSIHIEPDDLNEIPFNQIGGLGRAYELFGDELSAIFGGLEPETCCGTYAYKVNLKFDL